MVGYEPELNPPIDWKKELSELLRHHDSDDSDDDDGPPVIKIAKMSKPVLKIPEPTPIEEEDYYMGRLATPLIQVFSVSVSTNFDDDKPCKINGSIRVLEGSDYFFNIYDRSPLDSETVLDDGALSLIGPNGDAIVVPFHTTATLDLSLTDSVRGVKIVEGRLNLVPVDDKSYDRLIERVVEGAHGVAHVYYAVFRFAVVSTVLVTITNKNDYASEIYGQVVAGYGNGRMYCNGDDEVPRLEARLLDVPSNRPMHVVVGEPTPITLTRNAVAVPVYSSLTIQVNLWDSNGKTVSGYLQFPANRFGEDPLYIDTQNVCVKVQTRWNHAYFHLYNYQQHLYPRTLEPWKSGSLQKMAGASDSQRVSDFVDGARYTLYGRFKVEVFSVSVGGIIKNLSALCGTIIIDDGVDKFSIFKRDENCLQFLEDDGLACIEFNYRAIRNCEFSIVLNLKDPVRNLEVSRGDLGWTTGSIRSDNFWCGKRVCSVVRGKDGYATVHYEMFRSAVEALVEVTLSGGSVPGRTLQLHGTLQGRYSTRDYLTSYENKYYVNRLFECPQTKPLELKSGSKIPLLKSIVVVPVKTSLIIDAKLTGLCSNNVNADIQGFAEFKIDMCKTVSEKIPGNGYWIDVSVKFTM